MTRRERIRLLVAVVATLAVVTPLTVMWWQSRVPSTYSVMDMGVEDLGGGPPVARHHGGTSAAALRGPETGRADVEVELTARKQRFRLASGREVAGFTLNGRSPGPQVTARQGELVQVTLRNADVPDGVTLHWHGVDVPNAEDGVAGVTQDAVKRGGTHVYRFVAEQAGTYWYHSHQVSHEQVRGGLLGALVVLDREARPATDVVALSHTYSGTATVNGHATGQVVVVPAGRQVRVRVINTDNGATDVWVPGTPFSVLAVDGYDLHRPQPVTDRKVTVAAGGRVDLGLRAPADGSPVHVQIGGAVQLVLNGTDPTAGLESTAPRAAVDLLSYGQRAPLPFDPGAAQRRFTYDIGRRPGFVDGRPGLWWTVNGRLFPDVPMYVVAEGDVVRMTVSNHSGEGHPMHLHGHHAVVLSRNGVPASGSPWWVDSLEVRSGERYEIAFLADNPGIWMDHCHNLPHADEGLVAHLMYAGVTTPFRVGGEHHNEPE